MHFLTQHLRVNICHGSAAALNQIEPPPTCPREPSLWAVLRILHAPLPAVILFILPCHLAPHPSARPQVLESTAPAEAKASPSSSAATDCTLISTVAHVASLFRFIAPLVADPDEPGEAGGAADLDDDVSVKAGE